eukprot:3754004-Pleurochrysis_carterae.AAC.1
MRYATKLSIRRGRSDPCSTVSKVVLIVWLSCLSLPVVCISQGHIDYEVLDKHGAPFDEEPYNRWVVPIPDLRLNENPRLIRLFDVALETAER